MVSNAFLSSSILSQFSVDQIVMSKPAGGPKARNQAQDED